MTHPIVTRLSKHMDVASLAVVDAREGDAAATRRALARGQSLLILGAGERELAAVRSVVPVVPRAPRAALFVRPNGARNSYDVVAIESEEQADAFARAVAERQAAAPEATAPRADPFPDGLKYLHYRLADSRRFVYKVEGAFALENKTEGELAVELEVYGFLYESKQETAQILNVAGRYRLNPGVLGKDDPAARYVGNGWLKSEVGLNEFRVLNHAPNEGTNVWGGAYPIAISYADPLGGYKIYDYDVKVDGGTPGWSVRPEEFGELAGSQWYMSSPADALHFDDTWRQMLDPDDNFVPLPNATIATAVFSEASAYRRPGAEPSAQLNTRFFWRGLGGYSMNIFHGRIPFGLQSTPEDFRLVYHVDLKPITPGA